MSDQIKSLEEVTIDLLSQILVELKVLNAKSNCEVSTKEFAVALEKEFKRTCDK